MGPEDGLAGLMLTLGSGLVFAIAVLLLIYKMIDGELPFWPGLGGCALCLVALALAIKGSPPVSGTVLVVGLTLMVFFPFAEDYLEKVDLRAIHLGRMSKAYEAVQMRPDNYAAKLQLASLLYEQGFHAPAIGIASATLDSLSTKRDEVSNRSTRDLFYKEDILLKRWQSSPVEKTSYTCPGCGRANEADAIFCPGCSRPYLLDLVSGKELKPRIWAKLVLAWGLIAALLPASIALALSVQPPARYALFVAPFLLTGVLLTCMFRPPKLA